MRILLWVLVGVVVGVSGYSKTPVQYHIQTDTGPDRYFRFQTYNGQFRKEKRLDDGTVFGTYGWVDATGLLRLYDYVADAGGYRVVRRRTMQVARATDPPPTAASSSSSSPAPTTAAPALPEVEPEAVHSASGLRGPPARLPPTTTPAGGATRWGNRRRRPAATPPSGVRVRRPLRQQSSGVVSPNKGRVTTAKQTADGAPEQTSSGTSHHHQQKQQQATTGVVRDPAGIDDLPAEGKFTINYDLGNQFHFEKLLPDGTKVGKHGYVDPLGILRVSHYRSGPKGHTQRQESRWVGARHP